MSVLSVLLCLSLISYTCSIRGVSIDDLDEDNTLLTLFKEERLLYIGNMPPTVQRPDFAKLLYPEGYIDTTY